MSVTKQIFCRVINSKTRIVSRNYQVNKMPKYNKTGGIPPKPTVKPYLYIGVFFGVTFGLLLGGLLGKLLAHGLELSGIFIHPDKRPKCNERDEDGQSTSKSQ